MDTDTPRKINRGSGNGFIKTHGMKNTPEYEAWRGMKVRCYVTKRPETIKSYQAKGIVVCDRWRNSFEAFYADMGPRPSAGHSLDRIDNNGIYEPSNCRWATWSEQALNRDCARILELDGERLAISQWEARTGISRKTIHYRISAGWSVERALTTPVDTVKYPRPSQKARQALGGAK